MRLQLLRASDGVSRRVFVPRCFPVGASSSGWSSIESERLRNRLFFVQGFGCMCDSPMIKHDALRSDGEVACGTSRPQALPSLSEPSPAASSSAQADSSVLFGIGCTFRRDSRGRYRVKRVIKGGAAHASHAVLSGVAFVPHLKHASVTYSR
jgi:hypothetical protein